MTEQNNALVRALGQARDEMDFIVAMVSRLEHARECDGTDCEMTDAEIMVGLNMAGVAATEQDREDYHDEDKALQEILDSASSVEVRSDWHTPGEDGRAAEYRILLSAGGPATQIVGVLNEYGEPETADLQYQDWFTPWENYQGSAEEQEALLEYARQFCFGVQPS